MRNFDESYLKIADVWAQNSRAVRAKVGAIIVKDNMIISDGFNGTPAGFDNTCEVEIECDVDWDEHDSLDGGAAICMTYNNDCSRCPHHKLITKPEVLHAESNAIAKLAKSHNSSDGATLYVTLSPCLECAKLIIQSGIKRVVYRDKYRNTDGIDLLKRANIEVEQLTY